MSLSAICAVRLSFTCSSFLRIVKYPVTSTKNNKQINYPLSSTSVQLSQSTKKVPAAQQIIQLVFSHQYTKVFHHVHLYFFQYCYTFKMVKFNFTCTNKIHRSNKRPSIKPVTFKRSAHNASSLITKWRRQKDIVL